MISIIFNQNENNWSDLFKTRKENGKNKKKEIKEKIISNILQKKPNTNDHSKKKFLTSSCQYIIELKEPTKPRNTLTFKWSFKY